MCLCKGCEYCDITTWGDSKYKAILLCICCGGHRFIHRPDPKRCPNYRGP